MIGEALLSIILARRGLSEKCSLILNHTNYDDQSKQEVKDQVPHLT